MLSIFLEQQEMFERLHRMEENQKNDWDERER